MIAGVRGRVQRVEPLALVVELGPVDLRVSVPSSTAMRAAPGREIALHTHLYVREDQVALFGFDADGQLEIFELLLSVSGIGPRAALGVLSALEPGQVRQAILQGDVQTLTRAPGVGARAASRIVVELQSKVGGVAAPVVGPGPDPLGAALLALVGMGYSAVEARLALDGVPADQSVEEVLRAALGQLAER